MSEEAPKNPEPAQRPEDPRPTPPPPQEPDPPRAVTRCQGCSWRRVLTFGYGTFSIPKMAAQMAKGSKAQDDVRARREEACRGCPLFNVVKDGVFSCGVPITKKPSRTRGKDGCGYWLNAQWLGVSEKCPLVPPKW